MFVFLHPFNFIIILLFLKSQFVFNRRQKRVSTREGRGNWEKEREGKLRNRARGDQDILFEKKKLFLTKKNSE